MASYKPWKALERRHAKRLGGERLWRPDFGESMPDGQTDRDTWDCKALSRQRIVALFAECEKKYRDFTGSRRFHLCLFDPTRPRVGDLVVLSASDFEHLLRCEAMTWGVLEGMMEFDPPTDLCVCAETSTRNCPEHAPA